MKLSDNVYNILKWVGLVFCPAFAVLVGVLGDTWGLTNTDAIVTTINAIGVFIGALIGVSALNISKESDDSEE